MFFRILRNELKRKRTMNIILFLFIAMATMFLASSVSNLITVTGAVNYFMEISKVPNRLAIALMETEQDAIEEYLESCENISDYEVIHTYNITNERISIVEAVNTDETKYERTNTLCVHAVKDGFMKVFDTDDKLLTLQPGEIAFPKLEAEKNHLQVGDKVSIVIGEVEQEFTIAAITKDVVFGTAFMGFKRVLICEEDFERFENQEEQIRTNIYCINETDKDEFLSDWPKQNFTVISMVDRATLSMAYIMDMLVAAILIVVSICLILIAFMVLRFTIVFTLQEDFREIGIMKAIGLRDAGIKGVYLVKYLGISVFAAVFGVIASFPFGEMLLKQTIVNLVVKNTGKNIWLHILCAVIVVGVVLLFSNMSANRLRRFSAIEAIRNGSNGERYQAKSRMRLWKRSGMKPGFYMACNDILSNPKRFLTLAITFCLGTLLILLPLSALHTLTGDNIVAQFSMVPSDVYMNNGKADDYVAEKSVEKIQEDMDEIERILQEHNLDAKVGTELTYRIPCYSDDKEKMVAYFTYQELGTWERSYELLEGREPEAEDEILITDLTAQEMDVVIGDMITFQYPDREEQFIITGLFQSMMNMGKGFRVNRTAKLDENYISGILCIQAEVADMESEEAYEHIKEIFPDYEVKQAQEFIDDMMGDTSDIVQSVIYLLTVVVLVINSLITALMMKAMMAKERGEIALLKSIGFSDKNIRVWQIERVLLLLVTSIVSGAFLSKLLAPYTMGPIFAMMGANKIQLEVRPLETYIIYPLVLLVVTGLAACLCSFEVKKVDAREVNNVE